jgi:alkanesulfonate monooxygenase SsuD/methylene tetrahydromethanopterin reductase-like flavin-dependent oxidoreductase (luciferase family)
MATPRPTASAPAPRVAVASPGGAPACCGGLGAGAAAPSPPPGPAPPVLVTAGGATYSLDLAYWLGIRASVASKQPVTLKAIVQVIRSLDGRDKVTKVSQSVRGEKERSG